MRRPPQTHAKPTEFELELLQLLWKRRSATVRDLHQDLSEIREIGYTTILKTLQIMTDKELVKREEAQKAHIYRAVRSEDQTRKHFVSDLSKRLFSGSAAQLALHALSSSPISAEEVRLIRDLIQQKENER